MIINKKNIKLFFFNKIIFYFYNKKKSLININNLYFFNNENTDKFDCGCIRFKKYIDLTISNSVFHNNHSKSNGGAMYEFFSMIII